ncbi:hypothetical protein GR927_45125 [Mycolicibacterium sp. 3033]|nr:hypothetical protein [Mycolicibacterium aurantiacum]
MVGAGLFAAAPSHATPAEVDFTAYPAVDPAPYQVFGAHPSSSGWIFRTPAGVRCQDSLIPDLGIVCTGPLAGTDATMVSVSLTHQAIFTDSDTEPAEPTPGSEPLLLPVGSRFDAGNGVVCALPDAETLACHAAKPASWPADTVDPPDRHYGEHGFVTSPGGSRGH